LAVVQIYVLGTERLVGCGKRQAVLPDILWPIIGTLLSATGHMMSRARLCQELWPDSELDGSRHRLATALWRMRRSHFCLDHILHLDGEQVGLRHGRMLWIDALAIARRASNALQHPARLDCRSERLKLHRTLKLYRGDLLAQRDNDWIMIERERIRALYLDATYELARAHQRNGEWALARECCRALCSVEPLREDAQRLLIEAYSETGCRGLAIQQYRDFVKLLADEIGVEPMPETIALFGRISLRRHHAQALPHFPVPTELNQRTLLLRTRERMAEAMSLIDSALGT